MKTKEALEALALENEFDGVLSISNYAKCAYFIHGETVKIFRPQITRGLTSKILQGELGFFLRQNWNDEKRASLSSRPASLSVCVTMSLPDLVRLSAISVHGIRHEFKSLLLEYLRLLPNTKDDIIKTFGEDFFLKDVLQRNLSLATWLRAARLR